MSSPQILSEIFFVFPINHESKMVKAPFSLINLLKSLRLKFVNYMLFMLASFSHNRTMYLYEVIFIQNLFLNGKKFARKI